MQLSAIVLAAGKGTRMKSDLAKVLHLCLGHPLLYWVLDQAAAVGARHQVVVVGHQREAVMAAVQDRGVEFAIQDQQNGTGHAVQMCHDAFKGRQGQVIILSGDVPLLAAKTLEQLIHTHGSEKRDATVLTTIFDDPTGYGRIIRDPSGSVLGIVEHKDATEVERKVQEINSGIYIFDIELLFQYIDKLDTNNAQAELYLTDVLRFLVEDGYSVGAFASSDPAEIQGVNTIEQLAEVERVLQARSK